MTCKKTVAVLTGGGDCPGLNAVIRAITKSALRDGCRVYGVLDGFGGLIEGRLIELQDDDMQGIISRGGTILGTTNRDNPFHFAKETPEGLVFEDRHLDAVKNLTKYEVDTLFVVGGDGSLNISSELAAKTGLKIISVPKTIDNDLSSTDRTFGFDTAVSVATDAIDRLRTTGESHHRVMVLEVMGRYAGWIALHSGLAGGAHCIIIPEIPFDPEKIGQCIIERKQQGRKSSIIVVGEGAKPVDGELTVARIVPGSFEQIRLGGIGNKVADMVEKMTGIESRCTVLGYVQRGGTPTAYDRVLSTRYGIAAFEAFKQGKHSVLVSLHGDEIVTVPFDQVDKQPRLVPVNGEILRYAREIGVCFGD